MTRRERLAAIRERNENPLFILTGYEPYIEDRSDAAWLLAEVARLEEALRAAKLHDRHCVTDCDGGRGCGYLDHNAAIDRALEAED